MNTKKTSTLDSKLGNETVKKRLRKELEWAVGQFQGIRAYTQDGKIAVACAEAEERLRKCI